MDVGMEQELPERRLPEHEEQAPQTTEVSCHDPVLCPFLEIWGKAGSLGFLLISAVTLVCTTIMVHVHPISVLFSRGMSDSSFGQIVGACGLAVCLLWGLGVALCVKQRLHFTYTGFMVMGSILIVLLGSAVVVLITWGWTTLILSSLLTIVLVAITKYSLLEKRYTNSTPSPIHVNARPPGIRLIENACNIAEQPDFCNEALRRTFYDTERLTQEKKKDVDYARECARKAHYDSEQVKIASKKIRHLLENEEIAPYVMRWLFEEEPGTDNAPHIDDLFG